jgi:polyisoprenyl-phosphate glycosyltransferase
MNWRVKVISIIIPVCNEEEVVNELYQRLQAVIKEDKNSFELIFVNDGSTDQTLNILIEFSHKDPEIKIIDFSRNFGHQAALMAGLNAAKGEAVITMDADLQHPPELIPALIEKWGEGYDIVYTIRSGSEKTGLFKKTTSKFFYSLINKMTNVIIPEGTADFRLLDRNVVNVFRRIGEHSIFIRGMVSWIGFKQVGIRYNANPRFAGKTKYSITRMMSFAITGITSFSSIPLYFSVALGALFAGLSFVYGLYAVYARFFTNLTIEGWTSVLTITSFLGGAILITLGFHGLYLGKIFDEVKNRPLYLIRRTYGFEQGER